MREKISFKLNNQYAVVYVEPLKRLIDVLREDFNLTGPKEGCGKGECGACSVLINGSLMNSCIYPIYKAEGKDVLTIEGIAGTPAYEVLKGCFEEAGAVQCGFCTPGMIMASLALLKANPEPSDTDIREGLSGNLCRCTGYNMIVSAVLTAAQRGKGIW